MKYKRNIIMLLVFIIPIFCITSCIPYSEQDLGSGYYYLPKYEAVDIGCLYGSTIYKSDKILYFPKDGILINGGIIDVNHNNSYILVGQNISQADNEIEKEVAHFWIVVKVTSEVHGPLDFEQYLSEKAELGIPKSLKLNCEKKRLKK